VEVKKASQESNNEATNHGNHDPFGNASKNNVLPKHTYPILPEKWVTAIGDM